MTNPIDDNIPSIKPDRDQVEAYRSTKKGASKSNQSVPTNASSNTSSTNSDASITNSPAAPTKSSGLSIFNNLVIYAAIAGASYWFFQQHTLLTGELNAAEQRIAGLERQLSATDEEMGESTVAMRAKLEGLIEKTDKLWNEMDKLWASAWRKNQTEIKALRSKSIKAESASKAVKTSVATNTNKIDDINERQTAFTFNIDALTEQMNEAQSLKAQIDKLTATMNTLSNKSAGRDAKQIEVATMVQDLDTRIQLLTEQLDALKKPRTVSTPPVQ